jgi:hypothetical protein
MSRATAGSSQAKNTVLLPIRIVRPAELLDDFDQPGRIELEAAE